MPERLGEVYKITNIKNNKCYIGITVCGAEKRFTNHKSIDRSGAPFLAKAIKKHGVESFVMEVIDSTYDHKELEEKEKYYIKLYRSNNCRYGYNMLEGGYTNKMALEALKAKVLHVNTGVIYNSLIEASEVTGVPMYLISFNIRGRQDSAKGQVFEYVDDELRKKGEEFRSKRKEREELIIKRIVDTRTGIIYDSLSKASEATGDSRNLICRCVNGDFLNSKVDYYRYEKPELARGSDLAKKELLNTVQASKDKFKIRCTETGEIFNSCSDAAIKLQINRVGVKNVVAGKSFTCSGLHFESLNEDIKAKALVTLKQRTLKSIEKKTRRTKILKQLSLFCKPVRCVETGQIFSSQKKCGEYFKISKKALRKHIDLRIKINGIYTIESHKEKYT